MKNKTALNYIPRINASWLSFEDVLELASRSETFVRLTFRGTNPVVFTVT